MFQSGPAMSKKRPTEAGATRGGPHHAPRLRLDLGCAVFGSPCYGATVEEIEQDQDEEDIEDFVAFSIKSLEGFAILDGGATKTVSGFVSVQPVADQCEGTTIETTDVGFRWWRNGGSKHENLKTTR